MPPDGPGEIVTKLVPLLGALNVGIWFAAEIGKAGNVHGWIRTSGNRGVVEVRQTAASILESKIVDLVVADYPGFLSHARYVTIRLLRSSGVGILSEWLVLAADFDSRNRAGTNVGSNSQAVDVVEVMVDTQRVKPCSFKDWEIPHL